MFYLLAMGAPAEGGGETSIWGMLLPFVLMLAVIYFLLLRPQQKKQKQHQQMLSEVKKGDKIITTSGMYGTVFGINDEKVVLKVSDDIKLEFLKSSIAQKIS